MERKSARTLIGMSVAVSLVVVAACVSAYLYQMAQNTSVSRLVKLVDCTNQTVTAVFDVPKGILFHLVLGGATNFSGTASVRDGTNFVDEFSFSDETAMQCNWLDAKGYPNSKVLNWNSHGPLALRNGSSPQITVKFDEVPPKNAAIWICYVQRYGDIKGNSR